MNLSRSFTLRELTRTSHRGVAELNYETARTDDELLGVLQVLCQTLLQPIRDHYGRAVIIHSGYRCLELNSAIGGSRFSQHMKGEAADFHVVGFDLREVFDWIRSTSGLSFGQLILEGNVAGVPGWIHLSLGEPYRPKHRSGMVLVMDAGEWTRLDTAVV